MGEKMLCKPTAERLLREAQEQTEHLKAQGVAPHLAVILVGDHPASTVYVNSKVKTCEELGIKSTLIRMPVETTTEQLLAEVRGLNDDDGVHGILVQLPLQDHVDEEAVLTTIDPNKDVDGFHPVNVGRLSMGQDCLVPCTPMGCIELLKDTVGDLKGKHAVVIGRSNIVGKPMAQLLLAQNCTVTVMHSRTQNPEAVCRQADIVIAAVGRAGLVTGDYIKEGAVVVDVGINELTDEAQVARFVKPDSRKMRSFQKKGRVLYGDVFYDSALEKASLVSPVPGGVGKLTIAQLMVNCVTAAKRRSAS